METKMRATKLLALSLLLALAVAACAKQEPSSEATAATETAAPAEVAATGAAAPEPEALDPAKLELTMPGVERWLGATAKLGKMIQADPALEDATTMDASETIDAYVARLEAQPAVVAAIASSGTSPREYALTSAALTAALFAQGMLEAGAIKELPEGINRQHVEFVQKHKDEITAKIKALEAA